MEEMNKDLRIQLLKDTLEDRTKGKNAYRRLFVWITVFAVAGYLTAAVLSVYHHERFVSFVESHCSETEADSLWKHK